MLSTHYITNNPHNSARQVLILVLFTGKEAKNMALGHLASQLKDSIQTGTERVWGTPFTTT